MLVAGGWAPNLNVETGVGAEAGTVEAPESLLAPGLGAEQHAHMSLLASLAAMQSLKGMKHERKCVSKIF